MASNRPEDSLCPVMLFGDKAYLTSLTYGEAKPYKAPEEEDLLGTWAPLLVALAIVVGIAVIWLSWGEELFMDFQDRNSPFAGIEQSMNSVAASGVGLGASIATAIVGFIILGRVDKRRARTKSKAAREHFMKRVGAEKFLREVPTFLPETASPSWYMSRSPHWRIKTLESYARRIHRNKAKLSRGAPGRPPVLPADVGNRIMKELTEVLIRQDVTTDMRERGQLSVRMPWLFAELEAASRELDEAANRAHYG